MPLSWDELGSVRASDQFRITNVARRLTRLATDPWADYATVRQVLPGSSGRRA
jgi:DNA primase